MGLVSFYCHSFPLHFCFRYERPSFKINNCLGWFERRWERLAFLFTQISDVCSTFFLSPFQTLLCAPLHVAPRFCPPTTTITNAPISQLPMIYNGSKIIYLPLPLPFPHPSKQNSARRRAITKTRATSHIKGQSPRGPDQTFLLRGPQICFGLL